MQFSPLWGGTLTQGDCEDELAEMLFLVINYINIDIIDTVHILYVFTHCVYI